MDLALDGNGDLDLSDNEAHLVDGDDAIVQHAQIRLRLFRGEWFLDTRVGMPYYEQILVKNPDLVVVRALFRRAILETPGIEEITAFDLQFDASTRRMRLTFTAQKSDDTVLDFSREFILQ